MSDELQLLVNYRGLASKQPLFHYDLKKVIKNSENYYACACQKWVCWGGVLLVCEWVD
jgi:hypothetical protein